MLIAWPSSPYFPLSSPCDPATGPPGATGNEFKFPSSIRRGNTPPLSSAATKSLRAWQALRGLINLGYFGMDVVASMPILVGTVEESSLPFSSISVLRDYGENDKAYKVFSRSELTDQILDQLFRSSTIKMDWAAYPHYPAPEKFAPFLLDNGHLLYVNVFENAASTMETSAVAAENVARLLLSRMNGGPNLKQKQSTEETYSLIDL